MEGFVQELEWRFFFISNPLFCCYLQMINIVLACVGGRWLCAVGVPAYTRVRAFYKVLRIIIYAF